jgi:hypothetical protein
MNIFIGTPAYGGMVHIDYLNSILDFHKNKMPITVMNIGNESLITRGRNTVISYFHAMKQFTHLLFLDADIGLSAAGLKTLLSHDKDVIGAVCRLKGENATNVYGIKTPKYNLTVVDKVGTAVFMLSRKAVDCLIKNATPYSRNPLSRGVNEDITMYDVFRTAVVDGQYLSEDYFVCETLKKNGFEIYVDTSVATRHNGNFVFIYEGGL